MFMAVCLGDLKLKYELAEAKFGRAPNARSPRILQRNVSRDNILTSYLQSMSSLDLRTRTPMASGKASKSLGKVVVVGGCGFLGHHIVSQLSESYDARIFVLDRTTRNRLDGVDYYDADITSVSAIRQIFDEVKPDVIIHTAALPPTVTSKELLRRVNVEGTRNLVECAAGIREVKAFVYTSSASVVHDTVSDLVNADERWPCVRGKLQKEYYSETKVRWYRCIFIMNVQTCLTVGVSRPMQRR